MSNLNTLVLPEPVTWLIERSAFRVSPHGQDAESNEWLEEAHEPGEEGSFPVYTEQQVRALLATVTGKSGSNDSPLLAGVSAPAAQAAPAAQSVANADGRFTKNPVTIDAIKWTGSNLREVIAFTDGPPDTRSIHAGMAWEAYVDLVARDGLKIYTLEGKMLANIGDWIIRGIKGEYYPCKPDIFEATYTSAPQAQADARDAEQERWMEIGKAIERACIDQPDSTEIVISLERDAGTVTMFDPDGNEHDQFSHEDGFAGVVNAAIEAAIAAAKGEAQ